MSKLTLEQANQLLIADPTEGMGRGEKFFAGMGKTMTDYYLGAKQRLWLADEKEVAEKRALDAALMNTTAGKVGAFSGHLIPALIPGGQTMAGAAAIGGGMGLLQPTGEGESPMLNTALGVGGGMAGKYLGDKVTGFVGRKLTERQANLAMQQAQNAPRDVTTELAREAGYVIPPSQAGGGMGSRMLEGFAGKLTTAQSASAKNQEVTNRLAREALGLPADAPLTEKTLQQVRQQAGKAYEAVKQFPAPIKIDQPYVQQIQGLGRDYAVAAREFPELVQNEAVDGLIASLTSRPEMSTTAAIELSKKLRFDAGKNLKAFDDPTKAALGYAQRDAATAIEELVERNLEVASRWMGTPKDLVSNFRQARTLIAKTHDIEAALQQGGDVSARAVGKMMKKEGKMTGELSKIGGFAQQFPKASQDVAQIGSQPGISPLDFAASGIMGGAGTLMTGDPSGAAAALIPFMRPAARAAILSRPYQGAFVNPPSYAPGLLNNASGIAMPAVRRLAPVGGAYGLLELGR
ncbi:MAG TPA: hypothetical protein VFU31_24600 [Candidatus Binatia bacterium]|nr:hypothetical protein [Candidatus Binatia bacterium]